MITPGWTTATKSCGLISRIRFMRSRQSTMPPFTGVQPPTYPKPAPRGVTGTPAWFAARRTKAVSSVLPGNTTASGLPAANHLSERYSGGGEVEMESAPSLARSFFSRAAVIGWMSDGRHARTRPRHLPHASRRSGLPPIARFRAPRGSHSPGSRETLQSARRAWGCR